MKFMRFLVPLVMLLLFTLQISGGVGGSPTSESNAFIHTTQESNTFLHLTTLVDPDHANSPLVTNNPNVVIFTTFRATGDFLNQTAPTGVYYETNGRWRIFNQDISTLSIGTDFNIQVQGRGDAVFIHTATADSIHPTLPHVTVIDHPLLNANSSALVSVTQRWDYGENAQVYNNNHIGVYYEPSVNKWAIFNQNTANNMPINARFNVQVLKNAATSFGHTATVDNIVDTSDTALTHPLLDGNVYAQFIVTPGWKGAYNNHPIGVRYHGATGRWRVYNVDGAAMPNNAYFHVHITDEGYRYGSGNLFINGGFEVASSLGKKHAAGWNTTNVGIGSKRICNKYTPAAPTTKIFSDTGECAFKLVGAPGQLRKLVQNIPVNEPLHNYAGLSLTVRGKNVTRAKTILKLKLDDSSVTKIVLPGSDMNGTYAYKTLTQLQEIPEGRTVTSAKLTIQIQNGSGVLFIDEAYAYLGFITR